VEVRLHPFMFSIYTAWKWLGRRHPYLKYTEFWHARTFFMIVLSAEPNVFVENGNNIRYEFIQLLLSLWLLSFETDITVAPISQLRTSAMLLLPTVWI
jgi:hypothetical protein